MSGAFPSVLPAAINHLLAQESWARDKLMPHAGKIACVDVGLVVVRLKVTVDGLVEASPSEPPANVTICIKLADLPLLMQNRERAFSYVTVDGDAEFASTISQLSQSLRWEAEEDLSKWVGDIAASRIVAGTKSAIDTVKSTHQKFAENLAEYFLEEKPMLIRPQAVEDCGNDVTKLRDDIERLIKRVERLEGSTK